MSWRLIQKKKEMLDMTFEFCVDLKTVVSNVSNPTYSLEAVWGGS